MNREARWNSVGVEMIYTAESRSLAMAEVMVHFTAATVPEDYMMVVLDLPDPVVAGEIDVSDLPTGRNAFPWLVSTQKLEICSSGKINFCISGRRRR